MRTNRAPFNEIRVLHAISLAIDRQASIDTIDVRGEPTPPVARGQVDWALPVEQLDEGTHYCRDDPKEAKRLLAEAEYPQRF